MKHTDELYISHYNKDRGGDQGLFDKHYDGNLRFLSSSVVVRALIYLQSDTTYKVVFADSRVEKAFGDLRVRPARLSSRAALGRGRVQPGRPPAHPAEVQLPGDAARTPPSRDAPRSPPTPPCSTSSRRRWNIRRARARRRSSPSGFLCNLFRRLNNIHPLVPLAFIAG